MKEICKLYKVTWFGTPVPNILGTLNILNFGGEGPFMKKILLPKGLRLLPIISAQGREGDGQGGEPIEVPSDYLGLFFVPECWLKTNKD